MVEIHYMKFYGILFLILCQTDLFGQVDYALQWDRKWSDTIRPTKIISDSISCNNIDQSIRFYHKGNISIKNSGWFLCLEKSKNGKNEFLPLHFSDMGQIENIKTELRDVTNDKIPELILSYQSGFSEFHYESGGGWYHKYLVILDTNDLNILFSAITNYDYGSIEVHYKDEEISGVNNLTKYEVVSREESSFELEYVVRFQNNTIEMVCMKYINKGNGFKEFELLNPGIITFKWTQDKWIKE